MDTAVDSGKVTFLFFFCLPRGLTKHCGVPGGEKGRSPELGQPERGFGSDQAREPGAASVRTYECV